ncbi:uncharacterized protein [Euwallacea fornicatus]|uniref:uncharacterized protein n=1 Tax=Euwallacea fornicatus TaxID=995702 RepID=UPI00338E1CB9
MKSLYVVSLFLCAALAYKLVQIEPDFVGSTQLKLAIIDELKDVVLKLPEMSLDTLQDTDTATLNELIDEILPRFNAIIVEAGMDPAIMPDETIDVKIGSSHLTEGSLSNLATIQRYEDVTVSYDQDANKMDIEFILNWEDLLLTYKYHTKVPLISISGHVIGEVKHLKVHIKLGVDFNTYHLVVDALDFKHTGSIKLKFTGNGLVDWITNAMSAVFSTIFHNLILKIIKNVTMDPVEEIIAALNEIIDKALNPTTTLSW